MFQRGDLVVYGPTGVCRVEAVTCPKPAPGEKERPYYQLRPLHQDGVIYTPADQAKIPIRPVISAQEADALIDEISSIHATAYHAPSLQLLSRHYQELVRTGSCRDLAELVMSVYVKRQQAMAKGRRAGAVDERFAKQAQQLLHSELSVALGIPCEEVPDYIARRVEAHKSTGA